MLSSCSACYMGEQHPANADTGTSRPVRQRSRKRSDAVTTDEVREGEGGCLFDERSNLVEPLERPAMEGWAG
jgi:hypothetical protein